MTIQFDDGALLHAYVIEGDLALAREALFAHLSGFWGFQGHADPDLFLYTTSPFGIDDARSVRERGQMRPIGARKYFIIAAEQITLEAQNALLKTLEEPAPDTHFFLIVRTSETLLPTLRSRARILRHSASGVVASENNGSASLGDRFVSADIGERLAMIGKIDTLRKDHPDDAKRDARAIMDAIERASAARLDDPRARRIAAAAIDSKRRLAGRSPSLKMLLEHLALLVPRPGRGMPER